VESTQNEKKITKIKSFHTINVNPYPKWYDSVNTYGIMLDNFFKKSEWPNSKVKIAQFSWFSKENIFQTS